MRYVPAILIIFVVAVSGCVLPGGFFGQDVLSIRTQSTTNGARDTISVRNVDTIPHSPLLPGTPTLFSFVVDNNDKIKTTKNVCVDLFNAPLFRDPASGRLCNEIDISGKAGSCLPNADKRFRCSVNNPCDMLPGAEEQINFNLRTLSQNEIANVRQQTRLDWKVNYDFDGSLTYILPVVNMEEILKRQRSGDRTEILISKSHSSGPVQLDVELLGAPYLLAELPGTLIFKIRNVGSGTIENSVIRPRLPADALRCQGQRIEATKEETIPTKYGVIIVFPKEFVVENWPGKDFQAQRSGGLQDPTQVGLFNCNERNANGDTVCKSQDEIPIYRDESRVSMRFEVRLRDANALRGIPFRSFQISSFVFYNYELRGSQDITINPFENV